MHWIGSEVLLTECIHKVSRTVVAYLMDQSWGFCFARYTRTFFRIQLSLLMSFMFAKNTTVPYSSIFHFLRCVSSYSISVKGWLVDFNLLFNVMKSKLMCSCKTDREFLIGKEVLTDADVVIYRGINIHKTSNWPYREQPNYIPVECVKTWLFSRHAKLPAVLISSSFFRLLHIISSCCSGP